MHFILSLVYSTLLVIVYCELAMSSTNKVQVTVILLSEKKSLKLHSVTDNINKILFSQL